MLLIRYPEDEDVIYRSFFYPAGEQQVRLIPAGLEKVLAATKIWVQAHIRTADDLMGLCLLTSALDSAAPGKVKDLILPYLPYSRADRRFEKGDCFGLEVFASIINTLGYHQVSTLDAHSETVNWQINSIRNVPAQPLIQQALREITFSKVAILLPDKGALRYQMPHALCCEKDRDPRSGKLLGFKVPEASAFEGYEAILIIDDICDAGGTFLGISEALGLKGMSLPTYLYVSHGLFSKGTEQLLKFFAHIYSSDSFSDEHEGVTRFESLPYLL